MAMLAAYSMTASPVIVVDCGTAVTIDLVNERGVFVGGVIMPGLNTAYQSLKADTDAVEEISDAGTITSVSTLSTEEAVQAGVLFGLAGGIERVIREHGLSDEMDDMAASVFITGGDAGKLAPYLTIPVSLQADLVLQGLCVFADKCSAA
jgi:type III pantothenate kinase